MSLSKARFEEVPCPLCGQNEPSRIGIRGNREYHGADPQSIPHVWTYVTRCRRCDFIFTNPMIRGVEHLEEAYYSDPDAYQATMAEDMSSMFGLRLDQIEKQRKPGRLLDVGAGKGEFLATARRRGWEVDGVEPSAPFCRYAKERHGLELRQGYLGQTSGLAEGSYDAVTLNHVLEHVEAPAVLLELCARYLKPGGVLFIEVPNSDSYLLRLADLVFRAKGLDWSTRLSPLHPPFHRFGYTERSLTFALQRAGLTVAGMTTFSGADRGCKGAGQGSLLARCRDTASFLLSALGNRELLATVAGKRRDNR